MEGNSVAPPQDILSNNNNNNNVTPQRRLLLILTSSPVLLVYLVLYTCIGAGIMYAVDGDHENHDGRGYIEWLNFCLTAYTTIGYGHIIPITLGGKVVTIISSIFGIPLYAFTIIQWGRLLQKGLAFGLSKCFGSIGSRQNVTSHYVNRAATNDVEAVECHDDTASEMDMMSADGRPNSSNCCTRSRSFTLTALLLAVFILLLYMLLGSLIFHKLGDGWTYSESFYYVFVSLSTIGFGDLVPYDAVFFLCSFIYILFGLSLVAMVFILFKEVFANFSDFIFNQ